jgi:hypothetical protein
MIQLSKEYFLESTKKSLLIENNSEKKGKFQNKSSKGTFFEF